MSYTRIRQEQLNADAKPVLVGPPANTKKEKGDALCEQSPSNVHFYQRAYDANGRLLELPEFIFCQACGEQIYQQGARWVLDDRPTYFIEEIEDISDLL